MLIQAGRSWRPRPPNATPTAVALKVCLLRERLAPEVWAVCAWGPAGALRPSTRHWSDQDIGRSTIRFRPKPRGRRLCQSNFSGRLCRSRKGALRDR
jgi:hypothetical protein